MKKILAFILSILLAFSVCAPCASAAGLSSIFDKYKKVTCSTLNEASDFIFDGGSGEITITPVSLTENGKARKVYIVCVMGMGYNFTKPNNPIACVPAAFNIRNQYYRLVRKTMLRYIPKGAEVMLYGHSLGGMICQQLACDSKLKDPYKITRILTIGSPYIMVVEKNREGTLVRFADTSDTVPKLSPAVLFNRKNYKAAHFMDGGYNGDPDKSHNLSYREAEVWNIFDALGVEGGNAYFTYRPKDVIGQASVY